MESNRDIRFPASAFIALRRALVRELGMEAAGPALQEAGFAAGDALHDRLARGLEEEVAATSSAAFWRRLTALFRELGWGSMDQEELHPGVGALVAREWFEIDADGTGACPFTTGVLANILGRVAGDDVAVMQAPCEGDERGCARFLFGAGPVLQEVYSGLREGRDLQASLTSLG